MQIMAVAHGGRLAQDITGRDGHPDMGALSAAAVLAARHPVTFVGDSTLAAIYGTTTRLVNTIHHQAVADAGTLHVVGTGADGMIEAIESPSGPYLGGAVAPREADRRRGRGRAASCSRTSWPRPAPTMRADAFSRKGEMSRHYPKGYTTPLSPDGSASLVPAPPWHYVGDFLIVEYHTDPDAVIALLPKELEPAADPGAVAAIFADWQCCSTGGNELLDPVQGQYKEFFLVVGCTYQGQPMSRCVYIWVDKDFAMYRGWVQGFPKKLGSVHMTRAYPIGKATPRLEPGARFAGTCTAGSREIARAVVTLQGHLARRGRP